MTHLRSQHNPPALSGHQDSPLIHNALPASPKSARNVCNVGSMARNARRTFGKSMISITLHERILLSLSTHQTPFAIVLSKSSRVRSLSSTEPTGNARVAASASDVQRIPKGSFATISSDGRSLIAARETSEGFYVETVVEVQGEG